MLEVLFEISRWIIRFVMIPVVARAHRPITAIAWLAFIFYLPWFGLFMYLLFGAYRLRRELRGHIRVREDLETNERLAVQTPHIVRPSCHAASRPLIRVAEHLITERLGGLPILGGNAVELSDDPSSVIDRLIADIEAAERHVHLLFYHFVDDETGRRVAAAMAAAAARGVQCRLLVDVYPSRPMLRSLRPWMVERRIEVHTLLPINLLRRPLARFDIRNHRKLAVIDGTIGYTGSQNIHNADWDLKRPGIWQQIMARVTGPAVLQLQLLFVEDWYFATQEILDGADIFPSVEDCGDVSIQTVPGGPTYPAATIQHLVVAAIHIAERQVILTSPYFVPDEALVLALRLAALRGVEVHLIIPERSDQATADAASRAYFQELLDVGVHLHLHQSGILHAKSMSIDDTVAMIGTANLDWRSLYLNYEMATFLYDRDMTVKLRALQQRYLDQSRPLDRDAWRRRPLTQQWLEHTAKLLSPLL